MNKETTLDLNGHIIALEDNSIVIKEKVTITDSSENKTGKITSNAQFTIIVGSKNESTNGYLIHKGGTIEGSGYYTPAYIDGPPERCSPADSDADFKNYKFNNIEFENYIKRVFDKYEPFKDLEIVNVESWGGDLEVSEWDLDEDY